jgi:hypothetical protein
VAQFRMKRVNIPPRVRIWMPSAMRRITISMGDPKRRGTRTARPPAGSYAFGDLLPIGPLQPAARSSLSGLIYGLPRQQSLQLSTEVAVHETLQRDM